MRKLYRNFYICQNKIIYRLYKYIYSIVYVLFISFSSLLDVLIILDDNTTPVAVFLYKYLYIPSSKIKIIYRRVSNFHQFPFLLLQR